MKFDDILQEIGEFGPYQMRVYALVCIIVFPVSWSTMLQVFAMADSNYWCKVPTWNSSACQNIGYGAEACSDGSLLKITSIPLVNGTDSGDTQYQKCARYNDTDFSLLLDLNSSGTVTSAYTPLDGKSRDIVPCDAGWAYDRSMFTRTIIQEHDLVCGKQQYIQIPQSAYYAGYLVGSFVFGALADRFGRYITLFVILVLVIFFGFLQLAFHSYWAFTIIRFFQGAVSMGSFMIPFVLGTELVGKSKRSITGLGINIPYALGYMALAGIAYFIRDWRHLVIATTVPYIPLLLLMICIPESARWLLSRGKKEKAKKIILKAATINKAKLPENFLDDDTLMQKVANDVKTTKEEKRASPLDIFRHRNMCLRTSLLMYIWSVCAVVYHGLNLSTSTLGINIFISFMISGAIEIPAYLISIVIIERPSFGRRRSTAITFLIGGIACLLIIFIAPGPYRAAVGMIGKFGVTAAYGIVYLYTIELYPTSLRAVGIGICSMVGRVANIIAPFILMLGQYWKPAPLVIFGSATVLAGIVSFILPETQGMKLPDTVEEAEMFGRATLSNDMKDVNTAFPDANGPTLEKNSRDTERV